MLRKISPTKLITASLALSLGLFICGLPTLSLAKFTPPAGRGLPGRREGAGTRGPCIKSSSPGKTVIALVPETNLVSTYSEHPTFFWYLPANNANKVEFVLADKDDTELYKATLSITGEPGVISISLPRSATLSPLSVNELYKWKFALICSEGDPSANVRTNGWVQREKLSDDLRKKLEQATPLDRLAIYTSEGIWQESIRTLADLRRANPKDTNIEAAWMKLLQEVGLHNLAKEPILKISSELPSN
ncbi:MAG: DUF928 domain-containing protein [Leptolyngbyaceae bacterium]|nr:DUF928 domain-containing protein [Leptolyngbyaceae bacterium]